jgi:hypothetical protein
MPTKQEPIEIRVEVILMEFISDLLDEKEGKQEKVVREHLSE